MKKALLLITCLSFSLAANAGRPKIGPGFTPGIGDGATTGGGTNTEVTLPVGLPLPSSDPTTGPPNDPGASTSNIVYTFDLTSENGAASVNQTHAALENARTMNASCVLIRINSFAGGWDVAENIRQEILGYDRPVMVFVNNQAVPAASFISTGADSIYTKKGSTLSNDKAKNKSSVSSKDNSDRISDSKNANVVQNNNQSSATKSEYGQDVTMNEILYKAGLGNLTVVQHDPGLAEQSINFLTDPFVMLLIILLAGFVMRKAVRARFPGPMMYALALTFLLLLAPFQVAGLASGIEIFGAIALMTLLLFSAKRNLRFVTTILITCLAVVFTLVRTGDTTALLEYGSSSDLILLPLTTFVMLLAGWLLAHFTTSNFKKKAESKIESAQMAISLAA